MRGETPTIKNSKEYYLERRDMFQALRFRRLRENLCMYCLADCLKCKLFNGNISPFAKQRYLYEIKL